MAAPRRDEEPAVANGPRQGPGLPDRHQRIAVAARDEGRSLDGAEVLLGWLLAGDSRRAAANAPSLQQQNIRAAQQR